MTGIEKKIETVNWHLVTENMNDNGFAIVTDF